MRASSIPPKEPAPQDLEEQLGQLRRYADEAFALEHVVRTEGVSLEMSDRLRGIWRQADELARTLLAQSATEMEDFAAQIEARIWLDGGLTRAGDGSVGSRGSAQSAK